MRIQGKIEPGGGFMGTEREEVEKIQGTYRQVEKGFKGTDREVEE